MIKDTNLFKDCDDLTGAVHQAVGAASVCWTKEDRVFDDQRARRVAQDLIEWITDKTDALVV